MSIRYFHTVVGTFTISQVDFGWFIGVDGALLSGPYSTAQLALDQLISGKTAWPFAGNPQFVGLPPTVEAWSLMPDLDAASPGG